MSPSAKPALKFFKSENSEITYPRNSSLQMSSHYRYVTHVGAALLHDTDHIELTHPVSSAEELMSWFPN